MRYRLRVEDKAGRVTEFVDLSEGDPNEAGKAARELQLQRRRMGLDGIVVPFLVAP